MSTTTEELAQRVTAAGYAAAEAVGIWLDNPDDPHVCAMVHGGQIVYLGVSDPVAAGDPRQLGDLVNCAIFSAFALWKGQRDGVPPALTGPAGLGVGDPTPIPNATRATRLLVHTMLSSIAAGALAGETICLDTDDIREPSPAAQKVAVAARVAAAARDVERAIRAQTVAPAGMPAVTAARMLVERGEKVNAVARTYTPGPGAITLLNEVAAKGLGIDTEEARR